MRSIFRYPGGKTKSGIQDWILSKRPAGVQEYREPFVGGGGIFFGATGFQRRWINDKNPGLIAVYQALAERPEEFIAACRSILPAQEGEELTLGGERGGQPVNKRLKDVFDSLAFNEAADPALRYFFVNRTVFGGRVNYSIPSRVYFSNPDGWNIVANGQLEEAAYWIRQTPTTITCGDYERLFTEPGEGVWIYADPPYAVNSELSRTSQLYEHNFTAEDHKRLAEAVRACKGKHKVTISYDFHPDILKLYPPTEFTLYRKKWAYCGTTNEEKEVGEELLICNYKPTDNDDRSLPGMDNDQLVLLLSPERAEQRDKLVNEHNAARAAALHSFMEMGRTLLEINEGRLWEEAGSFLHFCRGRWGYEKVHLYRLMKAYQLGLAIEESNGSWKFPNGNYHKLTEGSIRPLTRLASFKQTRLQDATRALTVWERIVKKYLENDIPVTEKIVKSEVDAELGIVPKEPPTPLERIKSLLPKLTPQERKELEQWLHGEQTPTSPS